ncbi:MAG: Spy/CpxP family protein refolding chaperone [Magnetococcales bacterium]|nr:Spy/CpxP family protein refolding chaperone [Magnetococcales bacterium]
MNRGREKGVWRVAVAVAAGMTMAVAVAQANPTDAPGAAAPQESVSHGDHQQNGAAAVAGESGQSGSEKRGEVRAPSMVGAPGGPGYPAGMGGFYGPGGRMGAPYGPGYYPGGMNRPYGPGYYPGGMNRPYGPGYAGQGGAVAPGGASGQQNGDRLQQQGAGHARHGACRVCKEHKGGEARQGGKSCHHPDAGAAAGKGEGVCPMCQKKGCRGCGPRSMPMGMPMAIDPTLLGPHPLMVEQTLARLKERLAITQAQEGAWKGYGEAAAALSSVPADREQRGAEGAGRSVLALAEARTEFVSQLTDKRKAVLAAFKTLYEQLTDAQKVTINQFFGVPAP